MLDTGRFRPDVQPLVIIATIKKTTGTRTMRGPSRRRLPGASSVPEATRAGTSARRCDGTRSPPVTRVTIRRHHDFVAERSSRGRLFTPSHPLDVDGPPRAFVKTPCYSAQPSRHTAQGGRSLGACGTATHVRSILATGPGLRCDDLHAQRSAP